MYSESVSQSDSKTVPPLLPFNNPFETIAIAGIGVHLASMNDVISAADRAIRQRSRLTLGMVNIAKLVNAQKDRELRRSLLEANLVLADGVPVVWLSRLFGKALPERVAGIDVMYRLLELADRRRYSIFLLGAKEEVSRAVAELICERYPGCRIAGRHHGYFSSEQEEGVARVVRRSSADVLFVALSPPKKELFLRRWSGYMGVPVCHGVGGSLDVFAGLTRRAPPWMQRYGLEWLYRVYQEPQRLGKRYAVTNLMAIRLVADAFSQRVVKGRRIH